MHSIHSLKKIYVYINYLGGPLKSYSYVPSIICIFYMHAFIHIYIHIHIYMHAHTYISKFLTSEIVCECLHMISILLLLRKLNLITLVPRTRKIKI